MLGFIVILSGFPIYYTARLHWAFGTTVCLAAAAISASINIGEAVLFLCTNGIIGLSLGILQPFFKKVCLIPVPSAISVILMLLAVNYLFGINIFGDEVPGSPILQGLALFPPIYAYCFTFLKLAVSAGNLLNKYFDFRI